MPDKIPIENLLIDSGYLTPKQLERAMRLKQGRPECTIEEILTEFGYVTEAALLTCAAQRPGTIWRWRLLALSELTVRQRP